MGVLFVSSLSFPSLMMRVQGFNNMIVFLFIILELYYSFFYFLLEFSLFIPLNSLPCCGCGLGGVCGQGPLVLYPLTVGGLLIADNRQALEATRGLMATLHAERDEGISLKDSLLLMHE